VAYIGSPDSLNFVKSQKYNFFVPFWKKVCRGGHGHSGEAHYSSLPLYFKVIRSALITSMKTQVEVSYTKMSIIEVWGQNLSRL